LDGLTGRKAAATSERTRGVAPVLARRRGEETAEKAGHRRRAPAIKPSSVAAASG